MTTQMAKKLDKILRSMSQEQFDAEWNKITDKELNRLNFALERAAEEVYQNEMVDTNSHITKIKEFAEKYEYYLNLADRDITIDNCQWATKEEWIKEKINDWLYDPSEED